MKTINHLVLVLAALAVLPLHANEAKADKQALLQQFSIDAKSCRKPVWPQVALRHDWEGAVKLKFLIGLDGKVVESQVLESSGHASLDFAARDGLAQCQFRAQSELARTEPVWTTVTYVWKLAGAGKDGKPDWQQWRQAAEQGDAAAQMQLGAAYLYSGPDGQPDPQQGVRWLGLAAEQGNARAQYLLGSLLLGDRFVARDKDQAVTLLEKAAAQAVPEARLLLAIILERGVDAPQDIARARTLYGQASAQGSTGATARLGKLLLQEGGASGEDGLRLLRQAAAQHDPIALFALGDAHEQGKSLPQDAAKALAFYERAAASGYGPAKQALARLRPQP